MYVYMHTCACISRRLDQLNISQEDWSREAMTAFSMEVQDQILLMKMEYRSVGQVCIRLSSFPVTVQIMEMSSLGMRLHVLCVFLIGICTDTAINK